MSTVVFILWFVITGNVQTGELWHIPVSGEQSWDGRYPTQEACEKEVAPFLEMLKTQWPDDVNIKVYCEAFTIPPEEVS